MLVPSQCCAGMGSKLASPRIVGVEVGTRHWDWTGAAGFDLAGPAHQQGFAGAAFVHPALAFGQRRVAGRRAFGGGEAAVVRGEKHGGVFGFTKRVEQVEEAAQIFVEAFDHGRIDRVGLDEPPFDALVLFVLAGEVLSLGKGFDLVQAEGAGFGFVLGDFFWFGLDRRVDGVVPEIAKRRAARLCDGLIQALGRLGSRLGTCPLGHRRRRAGGWSKG